MTSDWQSVRTSAIRGTSRSAPPMLEGAAAALLAPMEGAEPDARLLTATAVLVPYQQAGRRPRLSLPAGFAPAPADECPAVSPAAGKVLGRILAPGEDGEPRLLREWCERAAAAGQRASAAHLPALLRHLTKGPESLRALGRAVLGTRGRWLAGHHPRWRRLLRPASDETAWETGTLGERVEALDRWRERDAAGARSAVEAIWGTAPPEERAALLPALRRGLSESDESFLERTLDDRRAEVRRAAGELLAGVPGSRHGARMIARARRAVRFDTERHRLRRRATLALQLPEALDKSMRRDGLSARRVARLGRRASLLYEVVRLTPFDAWAEHTPTEWMAAAEQSDFESALLLAWVEAAHRRRRAEWCEAVLEHLAARSFEDDDARLFDVARLALEGSGPKAREAFVARRLRPRQAAELPAFLAPLDHEWSLAFSKEVLAFALRLLGKDAGSDAPTLRARLEDTFALRADPETYADAYAAESAGMVVGAKARTVARVRHVLGLRILMRRELTP